MVNPPTPILLVTFYTLIGTSTWWSSNIFLPHSPWSLPPSSCTCSWSVSWVSHPSLPPSHNDHHLHPYHHHLTL